MCIAMIIHKLVYFTYAIPKKVVGLLYNYHNIISYLNKVQMDLFKTALTIASNAAQNYYTNYTK